MLGGEEMNNAPRGVDNVIVDGRCAIGASDRPISDEVRIEDEGCTHKNRESLQGSRYVYSSV